MSFLHEVYDRQMIIQRLLKKDVGDNPEEFYDAIAGIHEEAEEAKKEDTRFKEFKHGYVPGTHPHHKYDKDAKTKELGDILVYVVNACIYSDITMDELIEAIRIKQSEKTKKFMENA